MIRTRGRSVFGAVLMLAAGMLAANPAGGQELRVAVSGDIEITLGDPVEIVIESEDPAIGPEQIIEVVPAEENEAWHQARGWRRLSLGEAVDPNHLWTATYQPFETGDVALPSVKVRYRAPGGEETEVILEGIEVEVRGVRAADDESEDFLGLRGVRGEDEGWRKWLLPAAIAAAAALLMTAILIRMARGRTTLLPAAPPEPPLAPGPWAMREIDRRSKLEPRTGEPAKELATLSSDVIRRYIGRRWGIDAIDMTTWECLTAVRGRGVEASAVGGLKGFLNESDLIKFSKYLPAEARRAGIWDDARAIVKRTTPDEEWRRPHEAAGAPGESAA